MHNKFSNFLCVASLCAPLCAISTRVCRTHLESLLKTSDLLNSQVEKVQRTAARWTCRRWRNTSSVGEMLDELEWPSLEARRDRPSLLLFPKIHSGSVSIEKTIKYRSDPCSQFEIYQVITQCTIL